MPSKPWPKDPCKTVSFGDIAEPIRKAIEFAYDLKRKNPKKTIPWTGLDIGERLKASCLRPHELLSREQLAYDLNDQGRNALDSIIQIAIQLGIEQGGRTEREWWEQRMSIGEIGLKMVQSTFCNGKDRTDGKR